MLFGIINDRDHPETVPRSSIPRRGTLFALGAKVYGGFAASIPSGNLLDRALRILVGQIGHLERTLDLFWAKKELERNVGTRHDTLLAVYSLVDSGLTFDLVIFLANAEMERVRLGLKKTEAIIFAPAGFAIHQWMSRKVFCNMGGKPLINSPHTKILGYVESLARVSKVFPGIGQVLVMENAAHFYRRTLLYSHSYPKMKGWGGRFHSASVYKEFLQKKFLVNDGKDPVPVPKRLNPWRLFKGRVGMDKILVTVNLRNQKYTEGRNTEIKSWADLFADPFIRNHFHFFIFNDVENPLQIPASNGVTFLDGYRTDNFRRFKLILNVGLHLGMASGSLAVVTVSDTPYVIFGEDRPNELQNTLCPERYKASDRYLLFDKARTYQMYFKKQDQMKADFGHFLNEVFGNERIIKRYPEHFKYLLGQVLQVWPA